MTFYKLAIRYLTRKKSKTVLLFLVLVFIGSMVLSTSMNLSATEKSKSLIQEKTKVKVILEVTNEKHKISEDEIRQVSLLEGVTFINRQSHNSVFPVSCTPVTNSDSKETGNLKMTVFSYDDLENDSAFFEQRYRLIAGNYIIKHKQDGIVINFVINSLLANLNGLSVGDTMELETEDGITVSSKIIGIFICGSERKQADTTFSVNRIENHIFVDNTTYSKLFKNDGYVRISVYTENPEELDQLKTELRSIFSDKVDMTTSDILFQQTKAPLEQITRVVKLMLILTFVTGTVVVTILLCMWMRTRKKEVAIYISIGKSKISILLQVLLEAFGVFVVSIAGACGLGTIMAKFLQGALSNSQTADMMIDVSLKLSDIFFLLGIGSNIVLGVQWQVGTDNSFETSIGNRYMQMDANVLSGNVSMKDGRMIGKNDVDVCVVSEELVEHNGLQVGDKLQFNNYHDKENSTVYDGNHWYIHSTAVYDSVYVRGYVSL